MNLETIIFGFHMLNFAGVYGGIMTSHYQIIRISSLLAYSQYNGMFSCFFSLLGSFGWDLFVLEVVDALKV